MPWLVSHHCYQLISGTYPYHEQGTIQLMIIIIIINTRSSVPANVAIYQSAVAFTFILSVPLLRESVTVVKACPQPLYISCVITILLLLLIDTGSFIFHYWSGSSVSIF